MKQLAQLFFVFFFFHRVFGTWQDGVEIKSNLQRDELQIYGYFDGPPTDHLSLLKSTPDSLFVGGKDVLWNFSRDLKILSILNWTVSTHNRDQCQIKGQADSECFNFIRVFHGPLPPIKRFIRRDEERSENSTNPELEDEEQPNVYILCGTNAYKPTCRYYSLDLKNNTGEFSGVGYSPFDPTHQSTSVLHSDAVYAGTVADFGGTDALIYKYPLRTEQNDLKHLNSPAFVSSLSVGDFALFFFREFAIETQNCGKAVFSRVARICRHDIGSRKHKDRFTTFLKARLNCSVPGEFPFYLDHIRGTTDIFTNKALGNEKMLYAVFTTSPNSIKGSAVCAFSVDDILSAFDGPFKGQTSYDSNWLPVPAKDVPQNTSSSCNENMPNSNSVAFLKAHPLMDQSVQGKLVEISPYQDFFTAIEVDHSSNIEPYHIIYIGTESGKVLKSIVNSSVGAGDKEFNPDNSVISQAWTVFPGVPIKTLKLLSPKRLLVQTETSIVIVSVDNCSKFVRCSDCISIRDPTCGWDVDNSVCVSKDPEVPHKELQITLIQDVNSGDINLCPHDDTKPNEVPIEANHLKSINEKEDSKQQQQQQGGEDCACGNNGAAAPSSLDSNTDKDLNLLAINSLNDSLLDNEISQENFQQDFKSSYVKSSDDGTGVSSHSVVLATTSSAILSLLIGFALGFIAAKYISSRHNKTKETSNAQICAANEAQRLTTKPSIDFLVNVPTANTNPLKNNLNSETLERTVKKMYI